MFASDGFSHDVSFDKAYVFSMLQLSQMFDGIQSRISLIFHVRHFLWFLDGRISFSSPPAPAASETKPGEAARVGRETLSPLFSK